MKNKRLLTLIGSICLILVLAALPFMTACPAPPEEEEAPPKGEVIPALGALPVINPKVSPTPRIAYMLPNVGPWYNDKWYAVEDECKKLGFEAVMYSAGGYGNVAKQVAQVEDAIAAGYDGIIIHATEGTALLPPIKRALEAGIFVSTEHSPLAETIVPHIWEGPEETGRVLGMLLANQIGGEGKVLCIHGPPGQLEAAAMEEGVMWVFDTFFPKIQCIEEWPTAEVTTWLKITEDVLAAHPDLKGIYMWGAYSADGPIQALKAAGYKPGEVKLVTEAASTHTFEQLLEGWFDWVQTGAPVTVGRTSVQNMAKMFKGEQVPLITNIPMLTISRATAHTFDQTGWYWKE